MHTDTRWVIATASWVLSVASVRWLSMLCISSPPFLFLLMLLDPLPINGYSVATPGNLNVPMILRNTLMRA